MVAPDSINLIEEFSLNQKNNDYIILTSFCFDPIFFDNFLLPKIRTNNPFAEIIVLIDAGQYVKSLERFTDQTGRTYQLVPIYLDRKVFHPKLFTFVSKQEQKITAFVASSNITLTGFTRNAELVYKCEAKKENFDINLEVIKQFYEKLISNGFIRDEIAIQVFYKAIECLPTVNIDDKKVKLLHNIDSSILYQILKEINPESISECFLFAPFFSPNTKLLESICKKVNLKKIRIGIQKNNHNLTNPDLYLTFCKERGIECEIMEVHYTEDDSRIFHSKLLHFKGISDYLLIGSPNFTESALMKTGEQGNIEFAVFLKEIDVNAILDQFLLTKLEDPSQLPPFMESIKNDYFSSQLRIFSVKYDDLSKKLNVVMESIPENGAVNVFFEDEKKRINKTVALQSGQFSISAINEGIPIEIEITCNEKSGTRRIYYDRGDFFRNISRSKSSIIEISNRLCQDSLLDRSEVQIILLGILKRDQINSESIDSNDSHSTDSEEPKRSLNLRPSKISHSNLRSSIIFLDEIISALKLKKQKEHIQNNISPEESEEFEKDSPKFEQRTYHRNEIDKNLIKLINNVQDILVYDLFLSNTNPSKNEIVHTQASFFNIILRLAINVIGPSQIEHIEDILNENLRKIERDNDTKESTINLFKNMIVLNYFRDCQYHSEVLGATISYLDFFEPNVYYEVKDFVTNFYKQHSIDDSEFDLDKFHYHFCSLITFCFTSSTISKGTLELVQVITNTENNELVDFYGRVLLKLKSGPWDYPYSRFSLEYPCKKIKESFNDLKFQNTTARNYILEFIT
jgi:HKD family nuclease